VLQIQTKPDLVFKSSCVYILFIFVWLYFIFIFFTDRNAWTRPSNRDNPGHTWNLTRQYI